MKKEINVLIPDGEIEISLHVLHCLSEFKHIKVHVLSKIKWVEIRFSKNITSFNYFPESICDRDRIEIIKSEIIKKEINVLLPVHIKSIRLISKYRNEFDVLVSDLILPSIKLFDIANNKWELYKLLKDSDIDCPFTIPSNSINQFNINKLKFPVLIKPLEGLGGSNIIIINDEKLLLTTIQDKNQYLVQNYIKGYDIDMSVLCKNGTILAFTIQKGYVYRASSFEPSLGIEFLYNKELFEIIEKLMKKLNWSGVAHIDLRYDKETKKFKVIEINPRFWGSIEGSNKVGVNFPYLYCLSSLGIDYSIPEYRSEKYTNNKGLIKVLKHKIKNKYPFPKNTSIKNDILDPLPKIYKYIIKFLKKILPRKTSFLKRFKYEIF